MKEHKGAVDSCEGGIISAPWPASGEVNVDELVISDVEKEEKEVTGTKLQQKREESSIELWKNKTRLEHLKNEHLAVMTELDQMTADISRAVDMGQILKMGCISCDPKMKALIQVPLHSNIQLRQQITFRPPDAFHSGKFVYKRLFSGKIDHFPT